MEAQKIPIKWDTNFSTYFWCIHLSKDVNKVPNMWGYSKKEGQQEATDKVALLQRIIVRLFHNGYFDRMERIDFYQKTGSIINKSKNPLILSIYPKHYNIPSDNQHNHDIVFKSHYKFLEQFFDCVRNGKEVKHLVNGRRMKSHDDFLNVLLQTGKIRTVGELYQHAGSCLIHGHPEGAVNDFIRKFKETKRWP